MTPFRTELLFSILVHLCILLLFSYGMGTIISNKKVNYISVELIRAKRGTGKRSPAARPKKAKPKEEIPRVPEKPLEDKPKYTEYSEEAPPVEYQEDNTIPEGEEEGNIDGGNGGSPFGSDEGETRYEPFHRVSVLPSFKVQINPVYPRAERAAGNETKVVAEVYINERGGVDRVEIIKSGGKLFDVAVISAVKESSFSPAIMDGKVVAVRVKIPYTFKLR